MNALRSTDIDESLHGLPIHFVVWKVSQLLASWSLLFRDPAHVSMSLEDFRQVNLDTLDFDAVQWKRYYNESTHMYIPQQYVLPGAAAGGNKSGFGVSSGDGQSKSAKKRKAAAEKKKAVGVLDLAPPKKKPNQQQHAGAKGDRFRYTCLTDFLFKQDGKRFPECTRGDKCTLLHIPKPPIGGLTDVLRNELITSCVKLRGDSAPELVKFLKGIA